MEVGKGRTVGYSQNLQNFQDGNTSVKNNSPRQQHQILFIFLLITAQRRGAKMFKEICVL